MLRPRSSGAALAPLVVGLTLALTGCDSAPPSSAPPPRPPAPAAPKAAPAAAVPAPPVSEYAYETKGRRDPFRPLITPPKVVQATPAAVAKRTRPKTGLGSLALHELKLAGILWERRGYYALVEAPNGSGYVLRVNDVIGEEARVAKITPEAVTVEVKAGAQDTPGRPEPARLVELRLRKEE